MSLSLSSSFPRTLSFLHSLIIIISLLGFLSQTYLSIANNLISIVIQVTSFQPKAKNKNHNSSILHVQIFSSWNINMASGNLSFTWNIRIFKEPCTTKKSSCYWMFWNSKNSFKLSMEYTKLICGVLLSAEKERLHSQWVLKNSLVWEKKPSAFDWEVPSKERFFIMPNS